MSARQLVSLHRAVRDDIQDLVTRRPVPGPGLPQVDPFLFLNHHGPQTYPPNNRGLPFGPHPHRGFETVTFILEGSLAHHDSGSGASVVEAGGVQWMTAGSGLVHAELSPDEFKRTGGPIEILQLWVNLPARLKMTEPAYVPVAVADMAKSTLGDGASMLAVSGTDEAPIRPLTDVMLAIVSIKPGGRANLPAPSGRNLLFYTIGGEAEVDGEAVPEHTLARLSDGDRVEVSSESGCRILFGHAKPIGERVVAHGPFVMNTEAEIAQAVRDYQAGRFGGL
ncbi:pirin family protein [Qipengyuania atrilutea]|uniref:Pirin family protein n=1 Tax=Qipengyuania atrilutea TaxID=2744473 RepID=A0A850H453_9SPHN|nr:pirin family protein [Actirhodobacter atriluteus]NVD45380.1 pirin family protein [Actirhodobacter atriluteus]